MSRSIAVLACLAASLLMSPSVAAPVPSWHAAAGGTRLCGHVDVPGGRAWKILATRITCPPARTAAKQCLRGTVPRGWRVNYNASNDRTTLRSGRRVVSFQLVGGGGCIPVRRSVARAAAAGTLSLRPAVVRRGASVSFSGTRWTPSSRVELLIGPPRSEATHFAWARTNGAGSFHKSVRLLASARPGKYVVLACRRSCRDKASARLTITR